MGKPQDWNKLSKERQQQIAKDLLVSVRGHYLIGQALAYAITELRKAHANHREYSNIEDMEMLSLVFEPYHSMARMDILKKTQQNSDEKTFDTAHAANLIKSWLKRKQAKGGIAPTENEIWARINYLWPHIGQHDLERVFQDSVVKK